jgi:peptide/nickel transport system permease protein
MLRFLFRRLFYGGLVLGGVVTLVFFLFNILPGDPARMMMGQRADLASIESLRKELGPVSYTHLTLPTTPYV